jgi:hypothetical protein
MSRSLNNLGSGPPPGFESGAPGYNEKGYYKVLWPPNCGPTGDSNVTKTYKQWRRSIENVKPVLNVQSYVDTFDAKGSIEKPKTKGIPTTENGEEIVTTGIVDMLFPPQYTKKVKEIFADFVWKQNTNKETAWRPRDDMVLNERPVPWNLVAILCGHNHNNQPVSIKVKKQKKMQKDLRYLLASQHPIARRKFFQCAERLGLRGLALDWLVTTTNYKKFVCASMPSKHEVVSNKFKVASLVAAGWNGFPSLNAEQRAFKSVPGKAKESALFTVNNTCDSVVTEGVYRGWRLSKLPGDVTLYAVPTDEPLDEAVAKTPNGLVVLKFTPAADSKYCEFKVGNVLKSTGHELAFVRPTFITKLGEREELGPVTRNNSFIPTWKHNDEYVLPFLTIKPGPVGCEKGLQILLSESSRLPVTKPIKGLEQPVLHDMTALVANAVTAKGTQCFTLHELVKILTSSTGPLGEFLTEPLSAFLRTETARNENLLTTVIVPGNDANEIAGNLCAMASIVATTTEVLCKTGIEAVFLLVLSCIAFPTSKRTSKPVVAFLDRETVQYAYNEYLMCEVPVTWESLEGIYRLKSEEIGPEDIPSGFTFVQSSITEKKQKNNRFADV